MIPLLTVKQWTNNTNSAMCPGLESFFKILHNRTTRMESENEGYLLCTSKNVIEVQIINTNIMYSDLLIKCDKPHVIITQIKI